MIKRLSSTLLIALFAMGCASGQTSDAQAPVPDHHVDPAGTYDLVVDLNGMLISAVMTIQGNVRAGWTGIIESDAGPATLTEIRVDGHDLTFNVPEAQAAVELHIDGDRVHGEMTGGMGAATISGAKR